MGTRIVVMKDGFIQQVDSPLALYESPNNVFVAGFIGSPQMNFIDVKVQEEGGAVYLAFNGNKLKMPEGKLGKLRESGYIGKDVIFGIRPESVHDEEVYITQMPESLLDAKIDVIEMLGSETLLYMHVGDVALDARVNPRVKAKVGDTIKVAIDMNKMHLFDKDTENVILN
jgi:multiple sugar transport system ATP-binding protein